MPAESKGLEEVAVIGVLLSWEDNQLPSFRGARQR
jgi:hypothetical protein